LNPRPTDYESVALPLSYPGVPPPSLPLASRPVVPSRGVDPAPFGAARGDPRAVPAVTGGHAAGNRISGTGGAGVHPGPHQRDEGRVRARRRPPTPSSAMATSPEAGSLYSITWSARASIDGGMVRPSALAVFKLITNSNFVGCSTGRSAGFAPFKILSTYGAARLNKS
jgi:hypothetical protein